MRRKVSVVIPCYNHEKYIKQTIESVLSQSFTDFELLIADDCSTDGSRHIIESFDDPRITAFFYKENVGVVAVLNDLISKTQGEYIAVLGSDDLWLPDKLEKQVAVMDQNVNMGACFSYAEIIDENSQRFQDNGSFPVTLFFEKNKPQAEWLRLFFNEGNHLCHSSVLIRKSIHDELGVYNPVYRQLHDFDMWIRLISHYPIIMLEEVLVSYRRAGDQCISAGTTENNIRVTNELYHIISRMIVTLEKTLLVSGFEDLLEKKDGDIDLERFFILSKCETMGIKNIGSALEYLFDRNIVPALQEQYGMAIKDVYAYTGREVVYYPGSFISELNSMKASYEAQIESMKASYEAQIESTKASYEAQIESTRNQFINSTSWKITKPLRIFHKALKGKSK